jgi:hypothetical protein
MKHGLMATLLTGVACIAFSVSATSVQAASATNVPVFADTISGVVSGPNGPEAGVWVIAESSELASRIVKIVVTDDAGRYLVPELPKANYKVWVRGYGLVDSKPVTSAVGKQVNLTAIPAPDAKAAAEVYPANYWLTLMNIPGHNEFPGTGAEGNGIAPGMRTQQNWLQQIKDGCLLCHQVGTKITREMAPTGNSLEGWSERIKKAAERGNQALGNRAVGLTNTMQNAMVGFGRARGLKMFADWTDRVAAGETPKQIPPRPVGVERNAVVTVVDWGTGRNIHDVVSADRNNPITKPNAPVYGSAILTGAIEEFHPDKLTTHEIGYEVIPGGGATLKHNIDGYPHNPMLDNKGRVWATDGRLSGAFLAGVVSVEGQGNANKSGTTATKPAFCSDAKNKYAKLYPISGNQRWQALVYDPSNKQADSVATCFEQHHLMFATDKNHTLFFSGDPNMFGWIDTKVWDETKNAEAAQGWCPLVLDTDDTPGVTQDREQWNQPGKPADPKKDTRIAGFLYGQDSDPTDDGMWFLKSSPMPGALVRTHRGANPPETCKTEFFEPPRQPDGSFTAFNGRGVGVDSKGVAWVAYGSGKLASFDRKLCKVTRGPATANGLHCPEGWKFHDVPGPKFEGTTTNTDYFYLTWVDRFNTLGLGKDVPLFPGTNSDSMIAFLPEKQEFVHLRVPYPHGFYGHGVDGRIEQGKEGWKARSAWANYGILPVWHQEGGLDGDGPGIVRFQIRPNPLAN